MYAQAHTLHTHTHTHTHTQVCALKTDVIMQRCVSDITYEHYQRPASLAHLSSLRWQVFAEASCWGKGEGAEEVLDSSDSPSEATTVDACLGLCRRTNGCEAVLVRQVQQSRPLACFRKREIRLRLCSRESTAEVYISLKRSRTWPAVRPGNEIESRRTVCIRPRPQYIALPYGMHVLWFAEVQPVAWAHLGRTKDLMCADRCTSKY